ncbi:MAG: hypothetical protein H6576_01635 [Lewinellaceae bacterium]|nr:hypothetical protein [Saprospiraceae bacterium]MCB9342380.1 hypothetical protein [Lewinellaceae bacterium]
MSITLMQGSNFDWLSDLSPLFKAQELWFDGSYHNQVSWMVDTPSDTPFTISCGAALLAEHVKRFRFSPSVIFRLGQVTDARGRSIFQESFLNYLQRLRLRINVKVTPEGTLLTPGQPLLIFSGPRIQAILLESAFQYLIWDSSHWATQAALVNWQNKRFTESDTHDAPTFPFNPMGWKKRAIYIGGGSEDLEAAIPAWSSFDSGNQEQNKVPSQIRRLFDGEHPLGDVWLTQSQDHHANVSSLLIDFHDFNSDKDLKVNITRFLNLYKHILLKGHPILVGNSLEYLRRRTWKHLEAFSQVDLARYPIGWYQG